jgi:hypothetical protein
MGEQRFKSTCPELNLGVIIRTLSKRRVKQIAGDPGSTGSPASEEKSANASVCTDDEELYGQVLKFYRVGPRELDSTG